MTTITPDMINSSDHLFDLCGNYESEISARYILRFCQERGNWEPFSYAEINEFYQRIRKSTADNFTFNRLITARWIDKDGDKYTVTPALIKRMHRMFPKKAG